MYINKGKIIEEKYLYVSRVFPLFADRNLSYGDIQCKLKGDNLKEVGLLDKFFAGKKNFSQEVWSALCREYPRVYREEDYNYFVFFVSVYYNNGSKGISSISRGILAHEINTTLRGGLEGWNLTHFREYCEEVLSIRNNKAFESLRLYYGLGASKTPLDQAEIASMFNLSRTRINQLISKAEFVLLKPAVNLDQRVRVKRVARGYVDLTGKLQSITTVKG